VSSGARAQSCVPGQFQSFLAGISPSRVSRANGNSRTGKENEFLCFANTIQDAVNLALAQPLLVPTLSAPQELDLA